MAHQQLKEKVIRFLKSDTIAVCGVSAQSEGKEANAIFNKLKDAGHKVIPVNPKTDRAEGVTCYPSVRDIPEQVEAVMIVTPPSVALSIVKECYQEGIQNVWMHRSLGGGSVSQEAVDFGESKGMNVIGGACPMMFVEPVDFAHKCIRGIAGLVGKLPK